MSNEPDSPFGQRDADMRDAFLAGFRAARKDRKLTTAASRLALAYCKEKLGR